MTLAPITRQLFQLSSEVVLSLTFDEIHASYRDMDELGLTKAPYQNFDIRFASDALSTLMDKKFDLISTSDDGFLTVDGHKTDKRSLTALTDHSMIFSFSMPIADLSGLWACQIWKERGGRRAEVGNEITMTGSCVFAYRTLLVLLATRNVIRDVKEHKLAARGIGSGKYASTTTLKVGDIFDDAGNVVARGGHCRPHLRRGHIRRQRFGPGREFEKRVFIQPVFVNGADGIIPTRTAYNVSKSHGA